MTMLNVQIPGGQVKTIRFSQSTSKGMLADALASEGIRLNMRCGGRGLCNGCRVEVPRNDEFDTLRSCQLSMDTLPQGLELIRIPENSWRDHSLHGVSVFEIHSSHRFEQVHSEGLGIALDIGTTTLAGALWDFTSRTCLAHASLPNPQSRYGDNVLSRIQFAIEQKDGAVALQRILVKEGLIPLLRLLSQSAGTQQRQIKAATASGNPTMLHTLLGAPLSGFGKYPFKPEFLGAKHINSKDIGFHFPFKIELLPSLGPFVGSDIAAGALASGMLESDETILLIDFGTNGEILLKHDGHYLATATAAGPAFEGGRLNCGAIARNGVISAVAWENGWHLRLMGNQDTEPLGISGAAYVDLMAAGSACGLLDHFGRFDRSFSGVGEMLNGEAVDWALHLSETIFITEADVAELLQAKAAIGGGILTLMEQAGIGASDLDKVLVAGGFGYHLDPRHAIAAGLLPNLPIDRIQMIGNASLGGASLLLNYEAGTVMRQLVENCEVTELNQIDSFEDHFTDCLMLEAMDG